MRFDPYEYEPQNNDDPEQWEAVEVLINLGREYGHIIEFDAENSRIAV